MVFFNVMDTFLTFVFWTRNNLARMQNNSIPLAFYEEAHHQVWRTVILHICVYRKTFRGHHFKSHLAEMDKSQNKPQTSKTAKNSPPFFFLEVNNLWKYCLMHHKRMWMTRKHSSRMRTARLLAGGGVPRGCVSKGMCTHTHPTQRHPSWTQRHTPLHP